MDDKTFQTMENNLRKSRELFPDCRIANCKCDSNNGEWKKGCHCMCHFFKMDEIYGKGKWSLNNGGKKWKHGKHLF